MTDQTIKGWLPALPDDWGAAHLRWLGTIFAGGTPSKNNPAYWEDGTIPWLNSGSVNDWLIQQASAWITQEAFDNSSAKWVPAGSLVIALAGQGKTKGLCGRLAIDSTCNQSMAAFVPGPKVDSRYVQYWLTSNYQRIRNLAGGDNRDGLNLMHIGDIPTPVPALAVQHAIADFLDRECQNVEALVKEVESMGLLLEERSRVAQSDVACGRAMDTALLRETELDWLGSIPAHWKVMRLTACARLESGHTPRRSVPELWSGADKPWISLNDVASLTVNEYVQDTVNLISDAGLAASSARMLPAGTVVLSRDATIGRASIMGRSMATSQHFANWVCGPKLDPRYLWLLFTTAMQPYFSSITAGSTLGTIGMPELRQFVIPLPPLEEQKNLVQQAEKVRLTTNEALAALSNQRALLIERRQALITAAVSGLLEVA